MQHETAVFTGSDLEILNDIRIRCRGYPEVTEVKQFGHPWFKAGKRPFCVFGRNDELRCIAIAFSTTKMDQDALCQLDGFRPTPYMHQHGWTTYDVRGDADWDMIDELLDSAYRKVALARMIKKMAG